MNDVNKSTSKLDLASIRTRLEAEGGPHVWRSLEELAGLDGFDELVGREFPPGASEWADPASRRAFLKLMGASLALAGVGGVSGCSGSAPEKIVPYVRAPEEIVPGRPLWFATALSLGGLGTGVLVKSHMGRPIKVEGNEKHPDSLGAVDPFSQAAVLTLYDPDRSQVVTRKSGTSSGREVGTWDAFFGRALDALDAQQANKGAGLRILTGTVTSPTFARQIRDFLKAFPSARWHQFEPLARDNAVQGAQLAFGEPVTARYQLDRANVIVSLDADFLAARPGNLRLARQFAARREPGPSRTMNRLYVVEPAPSVTGSNADHRLAVRAADVGAIAAQLARRLGVEAASGEEAKVTAEQSRWLDALAGDLKKNEGSSVVLAGDGQPPAVHALAHAINDALKNNGKTVVYSAPVEAEPADQNASLRTLAGEMKAGQVKVLMILGGNPAYDAPVDLEFPALLAKVPFTAHLSVYEDETSALCHWHLPEAHELESWGDVRAFDGTVTIRQPLIAPLYEGRSAHEVLAVLGRHTIQSGREIVRDTWKDWKGPTGDGETDWRTALHDGVLAGSELPAKDLKLKKDLKVTAPPVAGSGLEIVFTADPTIWDGRFANNGWLQELPKPLTKLTWDNAALISPKTAESLGLLAVGDVGDPRNEVIELRYQGRTVTAPVVVMPGHADDSISVSLGYGRTHAGRAGNHAGFNAYAIRTSAAPWFDRGVTVRKMGRSVPLATTQHHRLVEEPSEKGRRDLASVEEERRELVRFATLDDFIKNPNFVHGNEDEREPGFNESLYPPIAGSSSRLNDPTIAAQGEHAGYAWGMVVNLNTCTGCNACVIACQAENNIPVVGKGEVLNGREMHWIEVDRYYHGPVENPEIVHQPRLCMHCENAPCEVVCPVGATIHDHEGINNMVYNRCVGTRYCSNNCPYKVRHFNFFQYADQTTPSLALLNNPDVTVRARGVMEKCTYCVQRINAARYTAEEDGGRRIRDGEVVTACQQACPTRAIVFGNINDPNSAVSKLKADSRNYGMLSELNTRPRTTYVAKLRNPNT
jgi:molybdopterin-containing oxidoreductase family iron-sulfur binding subunit